MFWTVIAPELIIATACGQLMEAREIEQKMKKYDLGDGVPWTLTHSYYANMGGFVVKNPSADKTIYHDPYHLTGEEIFELREGGYIDHFPSITEEEIKDKSKGDILGKLIALGQIAWSVCQIIARLVRSLPISPLEVAVVAFAVCAICLYALYWGKPQRVGVTQTIRLNDNNPLYTKGKLEDSPGFFKDRIWIALEFLGISTKFLHGAPISQDMTFNLAARRIALAVVPFSAALFGGIHAIAWNFTFPSAIELELWRCASICTAAAPACTILLGLSINWIPDSNSVFQLLLGFGGILNFCLIVLYSIARLFMIVEMLRTLYFLPPGSYISTWASNVPHLA